MDIRLIATDLDGTLLRSDHSVSALTMSVLAAVQDAGIPVVPISGRQPYALVPIAERAGLRGAAVCANGAIGYDLATGEVLYEELLSVAAQTALVEGIRAVYPGVRCVSFRDAGTTLVPERGYTGMMDPGDHNRADAAPPVEYDLEEVLAAPSVKLVLRQPGLAPEALLALATELGVPGVQPTLSGPPFLEVAAAGVTKSAGLARLCAHLGLGAQHVAAFGDHLNDLDLLQWAGLGVAMGNAVDEVKAVAHKITLTNDEDGLAVAIRDLLGL
ncbi:MAG: HAD family hydrolase [Actinomycetes bacterium]